MVCLSPMLPSATLSSSLSIPNNPSFTPSFWLGYADSMSFVERLYNVVVTSTEILFNIIFDKIQQDMLNSLYVYPGHKNCSSLNKLRKNIPLTFINSHYSVSYSRPYPSNVISIAGMHMQSSMKIDQVSFILFHCIISYLIYILIFYHF